MIELSNCCNAETKLDGMGDFHDKDRMCTMSYQCTKCNKPCDVAIFYEVITTILKERGSFDREVISQSQLKRLVEDNPWLIRSWLRGENSTYSLETRNSKGELIQSKSMIEEEFNKTIVSKLEPTESKLMTEDEIYNYIRDKLSPLSMIASLLHRIGVPKE